jgi:hypothetical protein
MTTKNFKNLMRLFLIFNLKIKIITNYKIMNQLIKPPSVDFNALVSKNGNISINCQSKMIELLNKEFTEEENRWYIANLYIYMNYHPTNDYPINLEPRGATHVRFAHRT